MISFLKRASCPIGGSMLILFAMYTLAASACSDDDSGNNDNDAGPDACVVNCDSSTTHNALLPISASSVEPSNGSSFSYSDRIVRPGFTMPTPDPESGYSGPQDGAIDVEGDNGTPGDTSDDWSRNLTTGTDVLPGSDLEGVIDLATECGSNADRACSDQETLTFRMRATARDAAEPNSQEYEVQVSFDAETSVLYCALDRTKAGGNMTGICYAADGNGIFNQGDWEINCDVPGGCGIMSSAMGSNNIMGPGDIGNYNISLRVKRTGSSDWSDWYSFPLIIDEFQSKTVIATDSETFEFMGNQAFNEDVGSCFPEFIGGQVSNPPYERNRTDDGQTEVTNMVNCIIAKFDDYASGAQGDGLRNYLNAKGLTPSERVQDLQTRGRLNPDNVRLVQVYIW